MLIGAETQVNLHGNIASVGIMCLGYAGPKYLRAGSGAEGGGPTGPDGAAASSRPPPPGLLHCAPAPQVSVHSCLLNAATKQSGKEQACSCCRHLPTHGMNHHCRASVLLRHLNLLPHRLRISADLAAIRVDKLHHETRHGVR